MLSPTRELAAQIARVLEALLPGTRLHASLLTKSTAAGTDFCKVRRATSVHLTSLLCTYSEKYKSERCKLLTDEMVTAFD